MPTTYQQSFVWCASSSPQKGRPQSVGRLVYAQANGVRFDYDGRQLSAIYDNSGKLLRRYVFGPGTDEPLIWFDGTGTADTRYMDADERGSIVRVTSANGSLMRANSYDEFGIPAATNLGRFQYTGQVWLPEAGLYDYKARMYSPTLGRFMQTDPTGYADGVNWYDYTHGDPVNGTDPSGLGNPVTEGEIIVTAQRQSRRWFEQLDYYAGRFFHGSGSSSAKKPAPSTPQKATCRSSAFAPPAAIAAEGSMLGDAIGTLEALGTRTLGVLGSLLSLSGDTPQPRTFRHYGYVGQAGNFAGGLRPGSFATTSAGAPLTGSQAQSLLALPSRGAVPDAYYNVTVGQNVQVNGPSTVAPANGQPGGGVEYTFPKGTPPGSVGPPNPIPSC